MEYLDEKGIKIIKDKEGALHWIGFPSLIQKHGSRLLRQ